MARFDTPQRPSRGTVHLPPPGLEHVPGSLEPLAKDYDAIVLAVRAAVLKDVEMKVTEKAAELASRGNHVFHRLQAKHEERLEKLTSVVTECIERQRALESENEALRQEIARLSCQMSKLGHTLPLPTKNHSESPEPASCSTAAPNSLFSSATTPDDHGNFDSRDPPWLSEVPLFPFAGVSPFSMCAKSCAAPPLLLAELTQTPTQTPSRTPLSLENTLTPPRAPEATRAKMTNGSDGISFNFTLRKADDADLGLTLSHQEGVLRVDGIRTDGAVAAWNRACNAAEKVVMVGDEIVSINGASEPERMLDECREKFLLKIKIRGERPTSVAETSFSFRATASEFVPAHGSQETLRADQRTPGKMRGKGRRPQT